MLEPRTVRRWLQTLRTLGGTPRGIAGGFALGLSLSLVPIPFAGMVVALALAPLLRLNLPATYLGTAVVNPLTGALFYFGELWLGMTVLGREPPAWAHMRALSATGWWEVFVDALLPFLVGAAIGSAAAAMLSFALLWPLVVRWQARRSPPTPADP